MNNYFYNENKFFHIFENDKNPKTMLGFSRVEDYFLYKGLSETWSSSYDYQTYAKLYIRVDNKKAVIKRKYQDFMEFYADNGGFPKLSSPKFFDKNGDIFLTFFDKIGFVKI